MRIPAIDGIDWSSITFSISGLFLLLALYGTRFLDLVPIARNTIIEGMSEGILVLDANQHLVDYNLAGSRLFKIDTNDLGRPIEVVLKNWPQVTELFFQPIRTRTQVEIEHEGTPQIFDLQFTRLEDSRQQVFGTLMVFRNITELYQAEQALRASEERYRTVADYTYDWGYWHTPDGAIQYMSPSCERVTGFRAEEFGENVDLLTNIVLSEDRPLLDAHKTISQQGQPGTVHQAEFRIRRRDGEIRWIEHICQTIYKSDGTCLGLRATNRDITATRLAEEKLKEAMNKLVEEQQFSAALDERQRLARDLHDSVNQSIHSLVLSSETLIAVLNRGNAESSVHIAEHLQSSARQALKEIRLLLYQLQPEDILTEEVNLQEKLEYRLNSVERRAGVQAEFFHQGELDNLTLETRQQIFRIAIEALNNSLKHAQSNHVKVSISCGPDDLTLEVRDNGTGFDPASPRAGGLGMKNMHERATLLQGDLRIDSAPDRGTRVRLIAPYLPAARALRGRNL